MAPFWLRVEVAGTEEMTGAGFDVIRFDAPGLGFSSVQSRYAEKQRANDDRAFPTSHYEPPVPLVDCVRNGRDLLLLLRVGRVAKISLRFLEPTSFTRP